MPSALQNLRRRIVLLMGGATISYPGPAKAEVVALPAQKQKPKPKPQLKMVRSEKRVVNG